MVGWAGSADDVAAKTAQMRPDGAVVDLTVAGWPEVVDRPLAAGVDAVLPKSQFRVAGATLIRSTWKSARPVGGRASRESR